MKLWKDVFAPIYSFMSVGKRAMVKPKLNWLELFSSQGYLKRLKLWVLPNWSALNSTLVLDNNPFLHRGNFCILAFSFSLKNKNRHTIIGLNRRVTRQKSPTSLNLMKWTWKRDYFFVFVLLKDPFISIEDAYMIQYSTTIHFLHME